MAWVTDSRSLLSSLRGFLAVFDLAQLLNLVWISIKTRYARACICYHVLRNTPTDRDILQTLRTNSPRYSRVDAASIFRICYLLVSPYQNSRRFSYSDYGGVSLQFKHGMLLGSCHSLTHKLTPWFIALYGHSCYRIHPSSSSRPCRCGGRLLD